MFKERKEPTIELPVSHKDSIGQKLFRYANFWRSLITGQFVLAGIIAGIIIGKALAPLACIFFGLIGWLLGLVIAEYSTIFIEAKAELLINTAKIQEDLEFLCKVKEDELVAKERPADQTPMQEAQSPPMNPYA